MRCCKVKEEINKTKTLEELINRFGAFVSAKDGTSELPSNDD